jgi:hypothetical protein
MPAILRARGDGTWTFVGPAYIAGLMEGQALAGLEEGIYTKRMFEMRWNWPMGIVQNFNASIWESRQFDISLSPPL